MLGLPPCKSAEKVFVMSLTLMDGNPSSLSEASFVNDGEEGEDQEEVTLSLL